MGFRFEKDAVYSQSQLQSALRISARAIGDACRAGELRFSDRAGKRFFRGQWINDWLDGAASDAASESLKTPDLHSMV